MDEEDKQLPREDKDTNINEKANKPKHKEPLLDLDFEDTSVIAVPPRIIDQVIGQEHAVEIIKKAALQKRHVMLIGDPGTGKSMLGLAMAELLPKENLVDILCLPNPTYPNQPRIATLPAGHGRKKVQMDMEIARKRGNKRFIISLIILLAIIVYAIIATAQRPDFQPITLLVAMFVGFFIFFMLNQTRSKTEALVPKLLVDNGRRKRAPFNDATGSHAGALLGDVRHDPYQSFLRGSVKVIKEDGGVTEISIRDYADKLFEKYSDRIVKDKYNNYEAIFLEKPIRVIGNKGKHLVSSDVLSINRYEYNGDVVEIEIENGKKIAVTPEHHIFVQTENGQIISKPAMKLEIGEKIVSIDDKTIIDEEDIVATFNKKEQKQYYRYKRFLAVKEAHPTWSNKRVSKFLGEKSSQMKWWDAEKRPPKVQEVINWLKEKELLPLSVTSPKVVLIAKVLGVLFGDGEISEDLDRLSLSSSEIETVREFQHDIEKIFNLEENGFGKVLKGGEKGQLWFYQSTDPAIIRLFLALGAPKGKKTVRQLFVPAWIYTNDKIEEQFFSSFLGSEIKVPKINSSGTKLQAFDVMITGEKELSENRLEFLNQLKRFLERKGVKCSKVHAYNSSTKKNFRYRLFISTEFSNVYQFIKEIKLNYWHHKNEKLREIIREFGKIKKRHYEELIDKGYGAERAMNALRLSQRGLYMVLSEEW